MYVVVSRITPSMPEAHSSVIAAGVVNEPILVDKPQEGEEFFIYDMRGRVIFSINVIEVLKSSENVTFEGEDGIYEVGFLEKRPEGVTIPGELAS